MDVKVSIPEIYTTVINNTELDNELKSKKTVMIPILNREIQRDNMKHAFMFLSFYFFILSIITELINNGILEIFIIEDTILKGIFSVSVFFSGLSLGCGISM